MGRPSNEHEGGEKVRRINKVEEWEKRGRGRMKRFRWKWEMVAVRKKQKRLKGNKKKR